MSTSERQAIPRGWALRHYGASGMRTIENSDQELGLPIPGRHDSADRRRENSAFGDCTNRAAEEELQFVS